MDGHEFDSAETAINSADQLIDYGPEILIFFHVLSAGNCDLDEDDFTDPLGMFGKEDFECVEFLWDAFDVIESIHSND